MARYEMFIAGDYLVKKFEFSYNSWHSKTFQRNHWMGHIVQTRFAELVSSDKDVRELVELILDDIDRGNYKVIIGHMRHYCGAYPRWYSLSITVASKFLSVVSGVIDVHGGTVWRFTVIKRYNGMFSLGTMIITDGCWDVEDIKEYLKAIVENKLIEVD